MTQHSPPPLKNLWETFVKGLGKHATFQFDENLTPQDYCLLAFHLGTWLLRGMVRRLRFNQAHGLTFIGTGVKIRYPQHLSVGKNFIAEDHVEIMALSQNGIHCGDNVTIGAFATIKPSSYYGRHLGEGLVIGNHSNIGRYSYIGCSGQITIGNNVMMGPRVGLFAENHNFADTTKLIREQGVTREAITIHDNCWIASSATILAGVEIGEGSIVAAGSVVTKSIPPYSIVAGSPARIVSNRKES